MVVVEACAAACVACAASVVVCSVALAAWAVMKCVSNECAVMTSGAKPEASVGPGGAGGTGDTGGAEGAEGAAGALADEELANEKLAEARDARCVT